MKITTLFGVLAIVCSFLSTPAYSRTKGTIVYQDDSFGRVAISAHDDRFEEITSTHFKLQQQESELAAHLEAQIQEAINGEASLERFNFELNGPYQIIVNGRSNGIAEIRVGGFSVDLNARLKKSYWAEGTLRINTSTVWLIGDYSIYSGQISNLRMAPGFYVSSYVDVDVDSILDLMPLFDALIFNELEDILEDEIQEGIYSALNDTLSSQEIALFGLDQKIENNLYVYNGRDFGQELKDHLANLFEGESLSIKVDSKKYTSDGHNVTLGNVEIRLSNNIFIRFIDDPKLVDSTQVSMMVGGGPNVEDTKAQARAQLISHYPNVDVNTIQVTCWYQSYGSPMMCDVSGYEIYGYHDMKLFQSITQGGPANLAIAKQQAIDALILRNPDVVQAQAACSYNNYGSPTTCTASGYLNQTFDYTPAN